MKTVAELLLRSNDYGKIEKRIRKFNSEKIGSPPVLLTENYANFSAFALELIADCHKVDSI